MRWLPLGVSVCFLEAVYTGNGFCDNEVLIDGERDLAFVFAAYHYHISEGYACWTSSLLTRVGVDPDG